MVGDVPFWLHRVFFVSCVLLVVHNVDPYAFGTGSRAAVRMKPL